LKCHLVTQMTENTKIASAINLAEIAAHPAEALAALVQVVQSQGEQIEHLIENQEIQAHLIGVLKSQLNQDPQPLQKDRGEVLKAILTANGGKMFAKDCRQQMHMPKNLFSMLLKSLPEISVRSFHLDKRRVVLELK
jgi:hypothetical protein